MSLVSDALRKARQEAAEREAARRGMAPPTQLAPRSTTGRFGSGLILGAVIAVVAAAGGAMTVWWLLSMGPAPGHAGDAATAVVTDAAEPVSAAEVPFSSTAGPEDAPGAREETEHGAAAEAAVSRPVAHTLAPAASEIAVEDAHAPPATQDAPAPRSERSQPEDPESANVEEIEETTDGPREFVLDADLGYARLSLGYVVFRASDPYAEINGRLVHEGWRIEGFVVEEITANTVRLRDERGELILRAR